MLNKDLGFGSSEEFNVLIEIPKGSPIKYEYNHLTDQIEPEFTFKNGFTFKYNYGFIPKTLAADGDPLDVMVLTNEPIESGQIIKCRAIGLIELLDRGVGDNKLLALPIDYKSSLSSIENLSTEELKGFEDFYSEVAKQKNKTMQILAFLGRDAAVREINNCANKYLEPK